MLFDPPIELAGIGPRGDIYLDGRINCSAVRVGMLLHLDVAEIHVSPSLHENGRDDVGGLTAQAEERRPQPAAFDRGALLLLSPDRQGVIRRSQLGGDADGRQDISHRWHVRTSPGLRREAQ